ncbi:MAG: heavy metal translocating P-type ATPase [Eubacteriales bacterium]|nr:heavy metal translocating P-type ATPase [Eubacteriales bacterium]
MTEYFDIGGMSCSACSARIERVTSKLDGMNASSVNLLANSMVCDFDESKLTTEDIIKAVEKAGFSASVKANEKPVTKEKYTPIKTRLWASIIFLLLLMYVSMGHMVGLPLPHFINKSPLVFSVLQLILTLPIVYLNRKFFYGGFSALFSGGANMDTLVAIGSLAAIVYGLVAIGVIAFSSNDELIMQYAHNLYFESAAMILTLVTVGKYLESRSKDKTGNAIRKLKDLAPKKATILRDGVEIDIDAQAIKIDDVVIIKPGGGIPVDGIIIQGSTSIDQSALTGESMPVEKTIGDSVMSASVNKSGLIHIKATNVGTDTTLSRIIKLVEETGSTKASITRIADKVSGIFVPVVIAIALISAIVWLIVGKDISFAFNIFVSVLVISCPCALGLATPVAVTVAAGSCAREGVLIKSAEALETLSHVDTIVFDKTGTLTQGNPQVTEVFVYDGSMEEFLTIGASLEKASEHPLAGAVLEHCKDIELKPVQDFSAVAGKGIKGTIDEQLYGGSIKYMEEMGIDLSVAKDDIDRLVSEGKTLLLFGKKDNLLGLFAVADKLKESSTTAIKDLKNMNIDTIMLTGDNKGVAEAIRKSVGIDKAIAEVLPDGKEAEIRSLSESGKRVAMVGDGINDSPALARADVGIAMAKGTDIAIDSADIILMKSDPKDVVLAVKYSKRTMKNIKENLFWAFFYNVLGIPVAAGILYPVWGITLSPMFAAAAMSFSSIFVVTNALRLYKRN